MSSRRRCAGRIVAMVLAGGVGVVLTAGDGRADQDRLIALGKRLASECTSCHKLDGTDAGIPSIVGWGTREFVYTMEFYQRGDRRHQIMNAVAQSLDGEQLEALAAYFGSLPRPPRKTAPPPAPK